MGDNKSRPWREEKRSWIFYKDEIKENNNIINDSVDGNEFMLDCETARLSIWSQEWNSFVEVGVNNLLKKEKRELRGKKNISSTEVCVFYKGMHLDMRNVKKDAGILEVIDIKGDLPRNYINISRGNFTRDGERYFDEELYPGLLDVVQTVLQYLAYKTTEKPDKYFANKIVYMVDEKCKEIREMRKQMGTQVSAELARLRDELISLTVSVSVLSYLAVRDEWNIVERMGENFSNYRVVWGNLITDIDDILSKPENKYVLNQLSKSTQFFNIKVYSEEHMEIVNDRANKNSQFKFRFTQIFLPKKHWAIFQTRKDSYSNWNAHLILLGDGKESEEFDEIVSFPRETESNERLERWAKKLCDAKEFQDDNEDSSQQFLLNWMLKNIPTVGMFCDDRGNVRVNILASRIYPSVFLNNNFKYLILERMLEEVKENKIQRFSTIAWQHREIIGCHQLPFNIFFIKRGYLSSYSYFKTIIPFDGKLLNELVEKINNSSDIKQRMLYLMEQMDYQTCISKEKNNESNWSVNEGEIISDYLFEKIRQMRFNPKYNLHQLLTEQYEKLSGCRELYQDIYELYEMILSKTDSDISRLSVKIKNNELVEIICSAWIILGLRQEQIFAEVNEVQEAFNKYIRNESSYNQKKEKIVDYLVDKGAYRFEREQIKHSVELYEQELLELFHRMECRKIMQSVERLFSTYSRYSLILKKKVEGNNE